MISGPRRALQIALLIAVVVIVVPVVIGLREDALDASAWSLVLAAATIVALGFVFDAIGKRRP